MKQTSNQRPIREIMSTRGACGADGRLDEALAWCRWFERTGRWPVEVMQGTERAVPARISPAEKSGGFLDE